MKKRLVLCFDGTWNKLTNPNELTNVVKIVNTVSAEASDGTPQVCYYNSGVGSGGPLDRFLGGVFGAGLKSNVKRGLAFLALNYRAGDEIYLFGFSRGAYTARALAGVLGVAGLPWDISKSERHWDIYRRIAKLESDNRGRDEKSERVKKNLEEIKRLRGELENSTVTLYHPKDINIACVGVFDTVGAYGIPVGMGLGAIPHLFTYWTRGFHSRQIGKGVKVALHAMAIDEMRRPFYPTFWMEPVERKSKEEAKAPVTEPGKETNHQVVEQMWFAGVHSNVGGGYEHCGLSDLALAWMISRVDEHTDLEFDESELLEEIWPCSASTLYRTSRGGPFARVRSILPEPSKTMLARFLRTLKKPFSRRARFPRQRLNEHVHWSVAERCNWPTALVDGKGARKYAPRNLRGSLKDHCKPTELELRLADPGREDWERHCPLRAKGEKCLCATRQQAAAAADQPPRSVAA
jgi:uncharacterized protein (DUF2235 family)